MSAAKSPTFSDLSRSDAIALLERTHVGRLAFTFRDRVDIEPISYVYAGGWLYARTSPGTKLDTIRHHPWVAFEVDEVAGRFDWQSVVVRGTIYLLDPQREPQLYETALKALRSVDADALTDADELPNRQTVFGIHADEITGRQATSST